MGYNEISDRYGGCDVCEIYILYIYMHAHTHRLTFLTFTSNVDYCIYACMYVYIYVMMI